MVHAHDQVFAVRILLYIHFVELYATVLQKLFTR